MANLIVRNVDKEIVDCLKKRAGKNGRSAEAEHRLILAEVLLHAKKQSFAAALMDMPDAGRDDDFERVDCANTTRVFD